MNPLISVIVPVYKVEQFLHRCIDSIVGQSYQNLEIILVDDGSPDRCGEICDKLESEDNRIRVYHKQNGGLSDARNYGVERSNGEYICFVDSDDFVAPDYVEYLHDLLTKHAADISVCCMERTKSDVAAFERANIPSEQVFSGKQACGKMLGRLHPILVTAWGKLYKRNLVEKYPFPYGKKHEDEATTFKYYYDSGRVAVGNRCLYAYYQNAQGIMNTLGTGINRDAIWAFYQRAEFFEEKEEYYLAKLAWRMAIHHCIADSTRFNGRCNHYLEELAKKQHIRVKERVVLSLWRISPKLYTWILRSRLWLHEKYTTFFKK